MLRTLQSIFRCGTGQTVPTFQNFIMALQHCELPAQWYNITFQKLWIFRWKQFYFCYFSTAWLCCITMYMCRGDSWLCLLMWINLYVKVSIRVFWEGRIQESSLVWLWVRWRAVCILRTHRVMGFVSRVVLEPCTPTVFLTGLAHTVSWSVGITTSSCSQVVKICNAFSLSLLWFSAYEHELDYPNSKVSLVNPFAQTHGRDTCELARSVLYTHGC
jgi:hypothetical protein